MDLRKTSPALVSMPDTLVAGGLPIARPGTVYRGVAPPSGFIPQDGLSQRELDTIAPLGLDPGTPIPSNLREIVDSVVSADHADRRGAVETLTGSGIKAVTHRIVDWSTLTTDEKARVKETVSQMVAQASAAPASRPIAPGVAPGVANVIRDIEAMNGDALRAAGIPGMTATPGAYASAAIPTAATPPPVASPPPLTTPPPATTGDDTGATSVRFCPHCGWDQTRPDTLKPTREERLEFLSHILVGDRRFLSRHTYLAGRLEVTFRSITGNEVNAVLRQLSRDIAAGRFQDSSEYLSRSLDYRMLLSIESLIVDGRAVYASPDLDAVQHDDGEPTPLVALLEFVQSGPMASEAIFRTIQKAHHGFRRLYDHLTDRIDDADFFAGIAPRA